MWRIVRMAPFRSAAQAVLLFATFGVAVRPTSLQHVEAETQKWCTSGPRSLCGECMGQTAPEVVETPHNSGSNFCTRDTPIDFPQLPPPFGLSDNTAVWMGMRYGKGVSKADCILMCRKMTPEWGGWCSVAKYHAQEKYCWLMPWPEKKMQ